MIRKIIDIPTRMNTKAEIPKSKANNNSITATIAEMIRHISL